MKKIVNILLALSISFGSIFAMKRPNHNQFNNEPQLALEQRIDDLIEKGDAESEKTLKNFAMLFYYIECLFEVVNAEKLAARYSVDIPEFDFHIDDIIKAINGLFKKLGDDDIRLFKEFDSTFSFVDSGFNFQNLMVFIEARRYFADITKGLLKDASEFLYLIQEKHKNLSDSVTKAELALRNMQWCKMRLIYEGQKDMRFYDFSGGFTNKLFNDFSGDILVRLEKSLEVLLGKKDQCVCCNNMFRDKSKFLCAACKSVFYCNRTCQKDHWKKHKKSCEKLKQELSNPVFVDLKKRAERLSNWIKKFRKIEDGVISSHDELRRKFFKNYMQAKSLKCAYFDLYKKIRTELNEYVVMSTGPKNGDTLPLRVFYLNHLCVTNSEYLSFFHKVFNALNEYVEKNSVILPLESGFLLKVEKEDDSEIRKDLKKMKGSILRDITDNVLLQQINQLFDCLIWKYKDNIFVNFDITFDRGVPVAVFYSPGRCLLPMIMKYAEYLSSEFSLSSVSNKKSTKKKKKKARRQNKLKPRTKAVQKGRKEPKQISKKEVAQEVIVIKEVESDPEEAHELGVFKESVDFVQEDVKGKKKGRVAGLAEKIKRILFEHDGVYYAKTDCKRFERVFGPLINDCVISDVKQDKKYDLKKDVPFSFDIVQFCRPEYNSDMERYMKQNHFHNFSKYVDAEMQNGLGSVITSTYDLPECCRSPYARALDKDSRIAIVLEGGLGTNKYYENLSFPHGYYMWIYSKDQNTNEWVLIHRCFHAEQH